jgi:hypothetical protein
MSTSGERIPAGQGYTLDSGTAQEARVSGEILNRLDGLHRHALAVALESVCSPA